jgi:RNA polymerase sigma-70 factor (ECF subfamily)
VDLEELSRIALNERRALVQIARSEGLGPEDALECVQDALSTFLARSEDTDHAVATIKTMVRNAARNRRRRHDRLLPHLEVEVDSGSPTSEELLAQAEEMVRLRGCVNELCGVQRAVVTLRLLEERSGEDVAEALGITRGHVDVLVHRAKAALRVCMLHGRRGGEAMSHSTRRQNG